jgi:hypothetical protein
VHARAQCVTKAPQVAFLFLGEFHSRDYIGRRSESRYG